MKTTTLTLLLFFMGTLFAQNDTLIVANNYKFKIGVKGLLEKSKDAHELLRNHSPSNYQYTLNAQSDHYCLI